MGRARALKGGIVAVSRMTLGNNSGQPISFFLSCCLALRPDRSSFSQRSIEACPCTRRIRPAGQSFSGQAKDWSRMKRLYKFSKQPPKTPHQIMHHQKGLCQVDLDNFVQLHSFFQLHRLFLTRPHAG